jgi:hypothetical protein
MKRMKNMIKLFVIVVLVAVIGFSMMECSGSNPFLGTWFGTVEGREVELTFASNKTVTSMVYNDKEEFTYTYKGTIATIFENGKEVGTATITSKNGLTLIASRGGTGTFTKIK